MCGIAGWISYQHIAKLDHAVVERMCSCMALRGPDAQKIWHGEEALLGHRRLAVIDLEGGAQPMEKCVHGRKYVITYNGELYNTLELKELLIKQGHTFQTNSDTEVLLTAFIEWKEEAIQYINGIFAFAIWDVEKRTLYAYRDRLGVKPFYYMKKNEELVFASEMKAMLIHPDIKPNISEQQLAMLLSLGPSHEIGCTPFQQIKELPPAHMLKLTPQTLSIQRYWDTTTVEHPHDEQQTIIHVRELLIDAIERQLVSDVPLCTFLSGGIDSSIITAVAANRYKEQGKQLHTYSIDYENHEHSFIQNDFQTTRDQYWIEKVQQASQTEHHGITVSTDDLLNALLDAMRLKDMPSMVDIDSSLLLFAREIRKDFTVALSGECADELFGGYRWFYEDFQGFPWIRSITAREGLLNELWREKLNLQQTLISSFENAQKRYPNENKQQLLFRLNRDYFMQTLLERKDRMTMGASLEVRVPFADHRLVEYVWNIPWEMKTTGGLEKGILRKAAEGLVPIEVLYRKKNPYPKTYDVRYTEGVANMLAQCLKQKDSILYELFAKEQLQQLIETRGSSFQTPWFGQLMAGPQLLAYFVQFHYWFEEYNINIV